MDISKIDKNFALPTKIQREGLVFHDAESAPFRIYGVYRDGEKFRRLPEAVAQATNEGVWRLHANTAGGRVRFVTDSPFIAISAEMGSVGKMPHFAFTESGISAVLFPRWMWRIILRISGMWTEHCGSIPSTSPCTVR